jgi:hypothetical protein
MKVGKCFENSKALRKIKYYVINYHPVVRVFLNFTKVKKKAMLVLEMKPSLYNSYLEELKTLEVMLEDATWLKKKPVITKEISKICYKIADKHREMEGVFDFASFEEAVNYFDFCFNAKIDFDDSLLKLKP